MVITSTSAIRKVGSSCAFAMRVSTLLPPGCEMHDGRLILIPPSSQNAGRSTSAIPLRPQSSVATGITMDLVEPSESEARA